MQATTGSTEAIRPAQPGYCKPANSSATARSRLEAYLPRGAGLLDDECRYPTHVIVNDGALEVHHGPAKGEVDLAR
jgi:hypothetical protein